jgi:putative DNA primase/helicase
VNSSTIDDFRRGLSGVRADGRGELMALCPAHADTNPSLRVWTDKKGRVAVCCMAGCEWTDVRVKLEQLGLTVDGRDQTGLDRM